MFAKPYATCCRTVHPPENLLGWMDFKTRTSLAKGSGWSLCSLLPMLKQPSWAWRNWKKLKECYFWTARLTPRWFVLVMQPLTYPLLVKNAIIMLLVAQLPESLCIARLFAEALEPFTVKKGAMLVLLHHSKRKWLLGENHQRWKAHKEMSLDLRSQGAWLQD